MFQYRSTLAYKHQLHEENAKLFQKDNFTGSHISLVDFIDNKLLKCHVVITCNAMLQQTT